MAQYLSQILGNLYLPTPGKAFFPSAGSDFFPYPIEAPL